MLFILLGLTIMFVSHGADRGRDRLADRADWTSADRGDGRRGDVRVRCRSRDGALTMRIAFVHSQYRVRGGEDVSLETDVRLLREHGHDVAVIIEKNADLSCFEASKRQILEPQRLQQPVVPVGRSAVRRGAFPKHSIRMAVRPPSTRRQTWVCRWWSA